MFCEKCGKSIEIGTICFECKQGITPVVAPVHISETKKAKRLRLIRIVICSLGICIGVIMFFFSFGTIEFVIFGGDFYTEIHDATRTAANNISGLERLMGAFVALFYGLKLCDVFSEHQK